MAEGCRSDETVLVLHLSRLGGMTIALLARPCKFTLCYSCWFVPSVAGRPALNHCLPILRQVP